MEKQDTQAGAAENECKTGSSAAPSVSPRTAPKPRRGRRIWFWMLPLVLIIALSLVSDVEYAYVPDAADALNTKAYPPPEFNLWERDISASEAKALLQTQSGRRLLAPENGAVAVSGAFAVGPFRGLSAQNNNVHALNADSTVQADQSQPLFGMDKEVYLATLLQNAPTDRYRWEADKGQPSAFFAHA